MEGEGGGRDREEDLEKKEGEKMVIYSSGFTGKQKAHSPIFLNSTLFISICMLQDIAAMTH